MTQKLEYLALINQREIMLAVAGMNGIKDPNAIMPAWVRPHRGVGGVTRQGALDVLMAAELKFLKRGALSALGCTMAEISELAA